MCIPTLPVQQCSFVEFVQIPKIKTSSTVWQAKETEVGLGTGEGDAGIESSWDKTARLTLRGVKWEKDVEVLRVL
jgi:hypothetical protein